MNCNFAAATRDRNLTTSLAPFSLRPWTFLLVMRCFGLNIIFFMLFGDEYLNFIHFTGTLKLILAMGKAKDLTLALSCHFNHHLWLHPESLQFLLFAHLVLFSYIECNAWFKFRVGYYHWIYVLIVFCIFMCVI